ncbi:MAG TPA: S8 family serine peptidase, partial [Candidatus Eisenbacteria bacterium]
RGKTIDNGAEDQVVQWVEPLREVVADGDLEGEAVTPGDETFINEQWNVQAMECPAAWALGYTGSGARVAVLDGGIWSTHVDLDGNLDVAASRSFVPGFAFNQDVGTFWHGTHVAGIIAAEDNGIGTIGVAPAATIIGVKVLHNGSGTFGQVISGILYAADTQANGGAGADIINMSLGATFQRGGGPGAGQLVSAIARAVNFATDNNVLVVCSAGNSALDLDHTGNVIVVPAQAGSGIAIAATGPVGYAVGWPAGATNFRRPASYTNYGKSLVHVAAPGGDSVLPGSDICSIPRCCGGAPVANFCWAFDMVISSVRGTGASNSTYGFASGTSMAAPVVCGVAALIKQRFPGMLVGDLKAKLAQTADDEGANGTDPYYGKGFVNARRAVTE